MTAHGIIVDLFAGGGGASVGIEAALGRPVDIAVNHDPVALAVHAANHPETEHLTADVWEVQPKAATRGRPVDLLWASPSCTHHSPAKGGKPLDQGLRSLAWVVTRWAKDVRPAIICLENVTQFREWCPLSTDARPVKSRRGETFDRWVRSLQRLGYVVDHRVLDAADFGAPTKRKRLFVVARCDRQSIQWPTPTHGPGRAPYRSVADCVDWSLPCPSIFGRQRPLAEKTMWRVALGVRKFILDNPRPYVVEIDGRLVVSYVAKHFGDPTRADKPPVLGLDMRSPLGTVTAVDHHSPVILTLDDGAQPDAVHRFLACAYRDDDAGGQQVLGSMLGEGSRGTLSHLGREYQIADIGLRMMQPHELLRAQFGRFADGYDLSAAKTQRDQMRLIGNSVAPEAAEALVRANVSAREVCAA